MSAFFEEYKRTVAMLHATPMGMHRVQCNCREHGGNCTCLTCRPALAAGYCYACTARDGQPHAPGCSG